MQKSTRTFTAADGVKLVADCWGDPSHPAVIFAHGGGQTRHSWGGTAQQLAKHGWYAISYDHRGHGDSEWAPDGDYQFSVFGADMKAVVDQLPGQPHVVGASLGGMSAMVCAGELLPDAFASITLVDVTPNLNVQGVAHIFAFMTSHIESGFVDLHEAAQVVANYTGRPKRDDYSGLEKNLRLRDGRYYWHWDPKFFNLRRDRANHDPERLNNAMRKISAPVLLIRGGASDVVTATEVAQFRQLVPHAEYVDVEHARHMVAGDRNDVFTAAVADFLQRQRQQQLAE